MLMGKHYSHLTVTERERLAKMYYERRSLADIAKALDRNKSTISRELSRNAPSVYRPRLRGPLSGSPKPP